MKSMRIIITISTIMAILSCSGENSFCEQGGGLIGGIKSWSQRMFSDKEKNKQTDQVKETPKKKDEYQQKEYSKDEMAVIVRDILGREEEILNFVPSVRKETGENEQVVYKVDGVKLEDLDIGTLKNIFFKVRQEATRIRNNRMLRQLESIRLSQRTTAMSKPGTVNPPSIPPSAPRIYSVPNIPKVPVSQPGQSVRIPSPPPAIPRRYQ